MKILSKRRSVLTSNVHYWKEIGRGNTEKKFLFGMRNSLDIKNPIIISKMQKINKITVLQKVNSSLTFKREFCVPTH